MAGTSFRGSSRRTYVVVALVVVAVLVGAYMLQQPGALRTSTSIVPLSQPLDLGEFGIVPAGEGLPRVGERPDQIQIEVPELNLPPNFNAQQQFSCRCISETAGTFNSLCQSPGASCDQYEWIQYNVSVTELEQGRVCTGYDKNGRVQTGGLYFCEQVMLVQEGQASPTPSSTPSASPTPGVTPTPSPAV